MQYLLWALLIYLVYRFITGFIWPVYKATTMVKKQFNAMREQMDEMNQRPDGPSSGTPVSEKPKFDPGGEYITFEEVKEK
jgi:hypothetical protein